MSNIYRSQEIYKRIPDLDPDLNPLRAIRGLYVSGQWTSPYYIDAGINVSLINSNKATIADFYITNYSIKEAQGMVNVIGYNVLESNIDYYHKAYSTISEPQGMVNVIGYNMPDINIESYVNTYKDLKPEGFVNLISLTLTGPTIELYHHEDYQSNKDHMIKISSISSTPISITNGA